METEGLLKLFFQSFGGKAPKTFGEKSTRKAPETHQESTRKALGTTYQQCVPEKGGPPASEKVMRLAQDLRKTLKTIGKKST